MESHSNWNSRFNWDWLNLLRINERGVEENLKNLKLKCSLGKNYEIAWLLKAVSVIDLTTLGGDDTFSNVSQLCIKAAFPVKKDTLSKLLYIENGKGDQADVTNTVNNLMGLTTAAVCVYPSRVPNAVSQIHLIGKDIPVASVATGFPSGQYPLSTRLDEIKYCVQNGAREIDIVLDRSLVIAGKWEELFNEVKAMKEACGPAHMKTILATGECGSLNNVAMASMVSMMAGTDFIKTSTGKETVNATLQVGLVMCRAIRLFYYLTGIKVGLKPAGGLKTWKDAVEWLMLVKTELGVEWLNPSLFRIGASSLLENIVARLEYHASLLPDLPIESEIPSYGLV